MKILTVVVFVSFQAFAAAQESSRLPVPVWPGNQAEAAQRYKGQSVFVNPEGTKLIVLLGGEQSEIAYIPLHKQIRPVVNVSISDNSGDYIYQYTVANEAAAKDPIGTWCIVIPKEPFEITMAHPGVSNDSWTGAPATAPVANRSQLGSEFPVGRYALWIAENVTARIEPGSSLSAFAIRSNYLPGFTTGFVPVAIF
jgi:hypothetical protein